jgi:hypothetical protein
MYKSSIVTKYGDPDKVKADTETLNDIVSRQSIELLIDVIAETVGNACNTYKLTESEVNVITNSLIDSLKNAIQERT